ncbi:MULTISPECIES: hypothetical protein [Streptomyces]|uniref:hypothetical protein n=1 Tax=Streptomyces TaxID=1883 RepID=UPI002E2E836A|nr:hypothetical protein [[Kitasatospora] papulosa]
MGVVEGIGPEAAAYAAALRAAVNGFTGQGGTQKEIAAAVHVAQATLSRYLGGERTAPVSFVVALEGFLARQGRPLEAGVRAELHELCALAHQASSSPAVQLAHLKEELAQVREEKKVGKAEFAALQEHADQLVASLRHALGKARHAEQERLALEERVAGQDRNLQYAQTYTRQLQAELTALQEQVVLIRQEVEVLRGQNKHLLEEHTASPSSGSREKTTVSGASTQATGTKKKGSPPPGDTTEGGKKGDTPREWPVHNPSPPQSPVYTVTWNGNEDPRTFTKNGLVMPGGLLLVLAFAVLYMATEGSAKDNPAWAYITSIVFLVGGTILCGDMIPPDKAKSAIPVRTLGIDDSGLTASDTYGKQHFARTSINKISIHHVSEKINNRAPLALHLQLHRWSPDAHRTSGPPAGWPLDQDPPEACTRLPHTSPDTWVPVCVLGPLTGPDKTDLTNALALYLRKPPKGIW